MAKFKFILLLITLLYSNFSCDSPLSPAIQANIITPLANQHFAYNEMIEFAASGGSGKLEWKLPNGTIIGSGGKIQLTLSSGKYQVILYDSGNKSSEVSFQVDSPLYSPGSTIKFMQTTLSQLHPVPLGEYKLGLVNMGESGLQVNIADISNPDGKAFLKSGIDLVRPGVRLGIRKNYKAPVKNSQGLSFKQARGTSLGDSSPFFVPNLTDDGVTTINAKLIKSSSTIYIWLDESVSVSESDIDAIWQAATRIEPKVTQLFGQVVSVNSNHTSILMTDKLNQSGLAIGFFNPADQLPCSVDSESLSYNPYSNECNLLTIGIPEEGTPGNSFSVKSLSATIAHEFSHLIRFQKLTRPSLLANSSTVIWEDLFLDEGLAHLTENLLGFSISGGNILFAKKYLDSPHTYSFSGPNIFGELDTVGRRGANLLILNWLFWKNGGVNLESDGTFLDNGGISFLHRMMDSKKAGWAELSDASSMSSFQILTQWLNEVLSQTSFNTFPFDLTTNEPLGFTPYSGEFTYTDGSIVFLNGLKSIKNSSQKKIASLAVALVDDLTNTYSFKVEIANQTGNINNNLGRVLFLWYMPSF